MEEILAKVTQQAMNYAIRSGITITSTYAITQCSRLMKQTKGGKDREELGRLQRRLESKIRIISPAIDMIELITARGNTSLESALALTKSLRFDIQALGVRLSRAAAYEELSRQGSSRAKSKAQNEVELRSIISDMRSLLERIEDAVPLINLAITTSGVSLSTNLPASISPSRLLQASTFLSTGDAQYSARSSRSVQIGPTFTLSMYMLFSGHALRPQDDEGFRNTTWQEVIHKARVKLVRTSLKALEDLPSFSQTQDRSFDTADNGASQDFFPSSIPSAGKADEFAYQLLVVEDLDDDRVHTFDEDEPQPGPFDDTMNAGIREVIPIHQISKIFYADTGKILNIGTEGEMNNPVLLVKRDINAAPPRRMIDRDDVEAEWAGESDIEPEAPLKTRVSNDESDELNAQFYREMSHAPQEHDQMEETKSRTATQWRLPPGLDPEWIALEVYVEEDDSETESDPGTDDIDKASTAHTSSPPERHNSMEPSLTSALANLRLSPSPAPTSSTTTREDRLVLASQSNATTRQNMFTTAIASSQAPAIRTSLSLLEMLIRLTSLQQFQQASHLAINDELLNFFLEEASTTGAAPGDIETRKRIRLAARARVGFDPYDESPIKRRGEQYQYHNQDDYQDGYNQDWAQELGTPGINTQDNRENSSPLSYRNRPLPALAGGTPSSTRSKRAGTPQRQSSSPGNRQSAPSLATPPGTPKTRQQVLRGQGLSRARSSPLTSSLSVSQSGIIEKDEDEDQGAEDYQDAEDGKAADGGEGLKDAKDTDGSDER